jgi:chromosome segregation ATPase
MERLIRELSSQITRAQEGVSALDEAAKESGDELRALVAKGQGLTDELALMTEAGNSLATRLEGLATRNRSLVDELGQNASHAVYPGSRPAPTLSASKPAWAEPRETQSSVRDVEPPAKNSMFTIRDPDFEDDDDKPSPAPDDSGSTSHLETQAERDLANAMRRRKMLGDS